MEPEKIQTEVVTTNDSLWKLRMMVAGLWTAVVFALTTLFLSVLFTTEPDPNLSAESADMALAFATVIVGGCAGGGWLCGLVTILIISAVLRR